MTIPYREWRDFDIVTLEGHDIVDNAFDDPIDWTNTHYGYGMVGIYRQGATNWWRWYTRLRPKGNDFKLDVEGRDFPVSAIIDYKATSNEAFWHPPGITQLTLATNASSEFLTGHIWDAKKATGRYFDGISVEWDNYPPNIGQWFCDTVWCPGFYSGTKINRTDVVGSPTPPPHNIQVELSGRFAGGKHMHNGKVRFFRNGIILGYSNWVGATDYNKAAFFVSPERCKVKYFNPVVNSLSTYRVSPAGGDMLIINGLGFDNSDADINEYCSCWTGDCADSHWTDNVNKIEFWTTGGTLVATLLSAMGQFVINSNSQITIASMPALAEDAYYVRLIKMTIDPGGVGSLGQATGYAGDWRTDSAGRMREGSRFVLLVADEAADGPPEPRFKWKWKSADDEVAAFFAPIDIRGAETFWEGRLKNLSPITRAIDDRTGLFSASDAAITLSNSDKEMSKMLSRYWLKNQLVEFYYGWGSQPEAWHEYFFRGVIDDYVLSGIHFDVTIRDLTHKYFQIRAPQFICTEDDYPDIHESAIGRSMPEALGLCSLMPAMAGETSGELEAIYIDTTGPPYSYLATHSPLSSVPQVYSDNVLKATPADYTIAYRDGGRTYIDFTADQGDNKITFNCTGCSMAGWNDPTNGYVQNPSYIISFFLTQIMGMPLELLDMESFDTLAALYTASNWHQAGKLILQDERDSMEVLKELLFSFGANLWIAKDGRLTIGRKNVTNFSTNLIVFEQIHAMGHAEKQFNLNEAVNWANICWDYIPTHTLYKSAKEESSSSSIEDFDKELSPKTPWNLPWNISDDFINQRIIEEILKAAYGYRKIKVTFPMDLIDDLDIFTNFRYQDPYGLSWTKEGDVGRYYYISSLTYDFQMQTIDVIGIDMQYILRQLFILGDETALADNWNTASESDKMFGYLCDEATGRFANGELGKQLCDENAL